MLRITKLADAEYLLGRVALGVEDYYVGVGEAPGVWQGRWAAELGLAGVVEADQLRALLLGRDPTTDVELLAASRPRTVTAFDVTFSAPKSVSLLWAFASPEVASVASIAHVEAVAVALDFLERRAGATRQQVDGERQRIPTGMAAATFVHRTSREGDPQLHTHCVVANLGRRPDGTYAALDATPLYEWGKAAGSVYQEELRRRLTERLGRRVGPGPPRMPGDGRVRPGMAADVLQADPGHRGAPGRRRPGEPGPGSSGCGPTRRHPSPPGPARTARSPPRCSGSGGRPRRTRSDCRPATPSKPQVCDRVIPGLRPRLEWDDVVEALDRPEDGLCAHRARFSEAHVVEQIAALGAGRLHVDDHRGPRRRLPRLRPRRPPGRPHRPALAAVLHRRPPPPRRAGPRPPRRPRHHPGRRASTRRWSSAAIAAEEPGLGADQADAVRALCAAGPGHAQPDRPGRVRQDHHRPRRRRRRHRPPGIRWSAWPPPTRPPANSARPASRP